MPLVWHFFDEPYKGETRDINDNYVKVYYKSQISNKRRFSELFSAEYFKTAINSKKKVENLQNAEFNDFTLLRER